MGHARPEGRITSVPYNQNPEMKLIESLADVFIMTFGITPPRPENRRIASWFIAIAMLLTVVAVLGLLVGLVVTMLLG